MKNVWNLAVSGGLLAIALGTPHPAIGASPPATATGFNHHVDAATLPVATGFNNHADAPAQLRVARLTACTTVPAAVIRSADGSERHFAASSSCDSMPPVAVARAAVTPDYTDLQRTRRVEVRQPCAGGHCETIEVGVTVPGPHPAYAGAIERGAVRTSRYPGVDAQGLRPTLDCTYMEVAALDAGAAAEGGQPTVYMVRHAPPGGTTLRNGDVLQIAPLAAEQRAPLVTHAADAAPGTLVARTRPAAPPEQAISVARIPRADTVIHTDANGIQRARLTTAAADPSARVITLCSTPLSAPYEAALLVPPAAAQWAPAQPAPK